MRNIIEKELIIKGVIPLDRGTFQIDSRDMSLVDALAFFKESITSNKKLLLVLWQELQEIIKLPTGGGNVDEYLVRLFLPAIDSLYRLSLCFDKLHNNGVVADLYNILCMDSASISSRFMIKIFEYKLGIEWLHHLILKELYIISLLKEYKKQMLLPKEIIATGTGGPWANLDHPMDERVYEWDDIDEEITGRMKDRQNQPRYHLGLENYNSPRINEGFYWEEVRRFPYDFDDEDDNPYPHRNLLWKS